MSSPSWSGLSRAAALALGPLVALGLTRFAYALLLPDMRATLGWSLAQAGALNTANAIGFIAGALCASRLGARFGAARVFTAMLLASALSLASMAWAHGAGSFLLLRALGGAATACVFVLGSALAPTTMPHRPATALALYFGGTGVGMVLASGAWTGAALALTTEASWRWSWVLFGAIALVCGGVAGRAAWRLALPMPASAPASAPSPLHRVSPHRLIGPMLVANALYGAGYVGYTTFVIALLEVRGFDVFAKAIVFGAIGAASLIASPFWGPWLERWRGGRGFAAVNLIMVVALCMALASRTPTVVMVSALLFGAAFMAGPTAVAVVARREVPSHALAQAMGALTAAFSIGQALGPYAAGALADATGRLDASLWLGPVLLMGSAGFALLQKRGQRGMTQFRVSSRAP